MNKYYNNDGIFTKKKVWCFCEEVELEGCGLCVTVKCWKESCNVKCGWVAHNTSGQLKELVDIQGV